jgi:hypothetical protein
MPENTPVPGNPQFQLPSEHDAAWGTSLLDEVDPDRIMDQLDTQPEPVVGPKVIPPPMTEKDIEWYAGEMWDVQHGIASPETSWSLKNDKAWSKRSSDRMIRVANQINLVRKGYARFEDVSISGLGPVGKTMASLIQSSDDPDTMSDYAAAATLIGARINLDPSIVLRDWTYITKALYGKEESPSAILKHYNVEWKGTPEKAFRINPPLQIAKPDDPIFARPDAATKPENFVFDPSQYPGENPEGLIPPGINDRAGAAAVMKRPEWAGVFDYLKRSISKGDDSVWSTVLWIGSMLMKRSTETPYGSPESAIAGAIYDVGEMWRQESMATAESAAAPLPTVPDHPLKYPLMGAGLLSQQLPQLAVTTAVAIATSGFGAVAQQVMTLGVAGTLEGGNAASQVAAAGGNLDEQVTAFLLTAPIAGFLEGYGGLSVANMGAKRGTARLAVLFGATRAAKKLTASTVKGATKGLTWGLLDVALKEGTTEALQQFTSDVSTAVSSDKIEFEFTQTMKNMALSFGGGALAGPFLGGFLEMGHVARLTAKGLSYNDAIATINRAREIQSKAASNENTKAIADLRTQIQAAYPDAPKEYADTLVRVASLRAAAIGMTLDEYVQKHQMSVADRATAEKWGDARDKAKSDGLSDKDAEIVADKAVGLVEDESGEVDESPISTWAEAFDSGKSVGMTDDEATSHADRMVEFGIARPKDSKTDSMKSAEVTALDVLGSEVAAMDAEAGQGDPFRSEHHQIWSQLRRARKQKASKEDMAELNKRLSEVIEKRKAYGYDGQIEPEEYRRQRELKNKAQPPATPAEAAQSVSKLPTDHPAGKIFKKPTYAQLRREVMTLLALQQGEDDPGAIKNVTDSEVLAWSQLRREYMSAVHKARAAQKRGDGRATRKWDNRARELFARVTQNYSPPVGQQGEGVAVAPAQALTGEPIAAEEATPAAVPAAEIAPQSTPEALLDEPSDLDDLAEAEMMDAEDAEIVDDETGTLFQMAGKESNGADKNRLLRAMWMEEQGSDRTAIWQETGWWRGSDNQWRYEIDPSNIEIKWENIDDYLSYQSRPLYEIVDSPELLEAYPELQGVTVVIRTAIDKDDVGAEYNDIFNRMTLSVESTKDIHPFLLHEIQHYIQEHESFDRGGNPAMMESRQVYSVVALIVKLQEAVGTPGYNDLLRQAAARYGYSPDYMAQTVQEANTADKRTRLARNLMDMRRLKIGDDRWGRAMVRQYKLLPGEIESRVVEERLQMGSGERKSIPPWETERQMLGREKAAGELEEPGTLFQQEENIEDDPAFKKMTYTSISKGWLGVKKLIDLGKLGLRPFGGGLVDGRKSLPDRTELTEVKTRIPRETMRIIREMTDEVWKVVPSRVMRSKGSTDYYLVPKRVVEKIKAKYGDKAFERTTLKERSPKQKMYDRINAGRAMGIEDADIGSDIAWWMQQHGITEAELKPSALKYLNEWRATHPQETTPPAQTITDEAMEGDERAAIEREADTDSTAADIGDFLSGLGEQSQQPRPVAPVSPQTPVGPKPLKVLGRKAAVRFLSDGRTVLMAFQQADLSSLLHELGHVFRRDLANEDLAAIEEWAGVVDGKWTRESEEKFARGFERYLWEGLAPNPRLKGLFERLRNWLLSIYRTIEGTPLEVNISKDVRRVFDRMFTMERMGLHPGEMTYRQFEFKVDEERKSLGSESEWLARYKVNPNQPLVEQWDRLVEGFKTAEKEMLARAEGDTSKPIDPDVQKQIDDIEAEPVSDKEYEIRVRDMVVEDMIDSLRGETMTMAKLRGSLRQIFSTGEDVGIGQNIIEGKEDQYEREARAKDKADAKLAKTEQSYEYRLNRQRQVWQTRLADLEEGYKADIAARREKAAADKKRAIDKLKQKLKDTVADVRAKAKATRKAAVEKVVAKYRTAAAKKKLALAARKETIRLGNYISAKVPKSVHAEYAEAIRTLTAGFDPSFRTQRTLQQRAKIVALATGRPDLGIPLKVFEAAKKRSLGEYTIQELRDLAAERKRLVDLGKKKLKLQRDQFNREVQRKVDASIKRIRETGPSPKTVEKSPQRNPKTGRWEAFKGAFRMWGRRMQQLADTLDGGNGTYDGPAYEVFVKAANESVDTEIIEVDKRTESYLEFMAELGHKTEDLRQVVDVLGTPMTLDDVVGVAALAENQRSYDTMIESHGLTEQEIAECQRIVRDDFPWAAALKNWVIDEYESQFDSLAEAYLFDKNEILIREPRYTSIQYLWKRAQYDDQDADTEIDTVAPQAEDQPFGDALTDQMEAYRQWQRMRIERGFTMARRGPAKQRQIRLGLMERWFLDIQRQAHYKSHVKAVRIMNAVESNSTWAAEVNDRYGNNMLKEVREYVNDVVLPDKTRSLHGMGPMLKVVRKNTALALLCLNMISYAKVPLSVISVIPSCGGPIKGMMYVFDSLTQLASAPVRLWEFVRKLDPQTRQANIEQVMTEFRHDMDQARLRGTVMGKFDRAQAKIGQIGMGPYAFLDGIARTVGWKACFDYARKEKGYTIEAARRYAQAVILRTQSASHAKDLPRLYKGDELILTALQFTNELNQLYNLLTYDMLAAMRKGDFSTVFAVLVVATLGQTMQWALSNRRLPEDDDDFEAVAAEIALNPIPLIGPALMMYRNPWRSSDAPVISAAVKTLRAGSNIVQGKWKKRDTQAMLEAAAIGLGVPFVGPKQIYRAGKYVAGVK